MLTEFIFIMKKFLTYITVFLVAIFVLSATSIFSPIGSSNENNNSNVSSNVVDFSQLTYSVIGDSITYGTDGIDSGRLNPTYVKEVKNILGLKAYYNYGIGGSTVANGSNPMYKRYTKINVDSDIISVMGGVNDWGSGHNYVQIGSIDDSDGTTFYGGYNLLIEGLKKDYPNAFIFLITPTYRRVRESNTYNGYGESLLDYVNAVRNLAKKHDLPLLDIFDNEDIYNDMMRSDSDGVHHSQELTINVVAPLIANFIKDNYNK